MKTECKIIYSLDRFERNALMKNALHRCILYHRIDDVDVIIGSSTLRVLSWVLSEEFGDESARLVNVVFSSL
jgi:hypothetical protein